MLPSWVMQALLKPTIRNDSIETCSSFYNDTPIALHEYDCVCVGLRSDKLKYYTLLKILSCQSNTPLHGPHYVQLYNNVTNTMDDIYTPSLTSLKKKTFQFIDRLSFERSTYLILYEQQKVIRLKNIRGIISLPCSNDNIPKLIVKKKVRELFNKQLHYYVRF